MCEDQDQLGRLVLVQYIPTHTPSTTIRAAKAYCVTAGFIMLPLKFPPVCDPGFGSSWFQAKPLDQVIIRQNATPNGAGDR